MKKVLICLMALMASVYSWGTEHTSGDCTITIDGAIITVSGNGAMADYETGGSPCYNKTAIKKIIIEDGVTYIGTYAFESCTNDTSVTIPTSVTSFGEYAFRSCGNLRRIFYAGTPNQWAQIVFNYSGEYCYSHPFNRGSASSNHIHFYGKTSSESKLIAFREGLKTIQPFVFYYAGNITDIYIPHSVTSIGKKAFNHCAGLVRITVLNTSAPTAATDAFNGIATEPCLFVPSGANGSTSAPGFKRLPWYNGSGTNAAKYIGYNSTDNSYTTVGNNFGTGKVYPLTGSTTNATWSLSLQGVLTITGNGNLKSDYAGGSWSSSDLLPWARFRRMVNKVIIKPNGSDITSLGNIIQHCYAIDTIVIDQTTIPNGTYTVQNDFKKTTDKVALIIKAASLTDASASNLGSAPWNNARLDIQLSDNLEIGDGANYSTILTNCSTYVEAPITLQLGRSLTNAQYNTFCSPIALTKEQLNNADIRELKSSSLDGEDLMLNFSEESLDGVEAGKPYLVKPSSELSNPTFENIAPSSLVSTAIPTVTSDVDFIGVLAPTGLTGGDHNTLFLGADNELFWPEADGNIKGMRAYFSLKGAAPGAKRARIVMNKEAMTDIETVRGERLEVSGRKILRNGQILIIRDGKEYNVMGIMMK